MLNDWSDHVPPPPRRPLPLWRRNMVEAVLWLAAGYLLVMAVITIWERL